MFPEVESILASVLALDERFRPLCRDCWGYAIVNGEREGVLFARMLLRCAERVPPGPRCRVCSGPIRHRLLTTTCYECVLAAPPAARE